MTLTAHRVLTYNFSFLFWMMPPLMFVDIVPACPVKVG